MRKLIVALLSALMVGWFGPVESASADGAAGGDTSVRETGSGAWEGRVRKAVERQSHKAAEKPRKRSVDAHKTLAAPKPKKLSKTEVSAIMVMCREAPGGVCTDAPKAAAKNQPTTAQSVASLSAIARTLIVRLQLPDPTPRFGPDPSVNEWKMAAVGYPLWLWTDGPATVSNRVQAYGVTFTLRAMWQSTTFDMGDGHEVTCTSTRKYVAGTPPGRKSPTCGYTYLTSSLPKGDYRVTATTNWLISWSALGQSGSLPGSHSATLSLPVGELNALVVR